MQDVTKEVIDSITAAYNENSADFLYFFTLYNIFNEFLEDVSGDILPNEATGFKESKIWNMLYSFQKDAAPTIISKLEKFNGCILADSVGLGKTFSALAVIKYYENRNRSVLVLCHKKLTDNWNTFKDEIGRFPERLKPISLRPNLTDLPSAINYNEIYAELMKLNLAVYIPTGLNFDSVWDNIVIQIGGVTVVEGNTLDEQLAADEERFKLNRRIEQLEKQARSEKQPRRKWELAEEVKRMKEKSFDFCNTGGEINA